MFTDTHIHLYLPEFKNDLGLLIEKANNKNIQRFFLPNIDSSTIESMLRVADEFPGQMFPMIGLHPCSVNKNFEKELEIIKQFLDKPPIQLNYQKEAEPGQPLINSGGHFWAAIGEIGIDLFWDKSFVLDQELAFRRQVEWSVEKKLPIVIHSRNSTGEIINILAEMKKPLKGIFHCFSGTIEQAEKILSLGNFKLGIGGVVTFKNSGLDKVVAEVDLKDIVLETDAPYLAPVPFRGKRNEPEYLFEVAKKIAEIKGVSVEEVGDITTANSFEIFGK